MNFLFNDFSNKIALEIGGPSNLFNDNIYKTIKKLDNVIWSNNTIWYNNNTDIYNFMEGREISYGKNITEDAVSLKNISDKSYDMTISSHSLEHIANPIKALKEWIRVTKTDIILILPNKYETFDHKRDYTKFETILDKYNRDIGEDNLESLNEILEKHDLDLDKPAGTLEQFKIRSLDNYNNRALHHHVFNYDLVYNICEYLNISLIDHNIDGINMWFHLKI